MKKEIWSRTLGSIALSMAALAWGILPAGAQSASKQEMAANAHKPMMQMGCINNAEKKAAAQRLAAKRLEAEKHHPPAASDAVKPKLGPRQTQRQRNGSYQQ